MADEFNPQGVDQTPQKNENPNNTADTAATEPIPDYASAKGESTVVDTVAPASFTRPTAIFARLPSCRWARKPR